MKTRTLGLLAVAAAAVGTVFWLRGEGEPESGPRNLPERRISAAKRAEGYATMAKAVAEEGAPVRPSKPPEPGRDVPPEPDLPARPPNARDIRAEAWASAVKGGAERPGHSAFRTMVSAFTQHNRAAAEVQAQQEGLTVEEVEELTYFGLMVQETQRWADVEELLGHPVEEGVRVAGEKLMHDLNAEFKARMRALVRQGATPAERWKFIEETQARYRQAYFELTGMNDTLLDSLLAGDASRAYAPATTSPPDDRPAAAETDAPPSTERPEAHPEEAVPTSPDEDPEAPPRDAPDGE